MLLVVLIATTGPAKAQIDDPPVTLEEYPNTDGSTSARPIGRVVFFEMFGVPWERVGQPPVPYGFSPEDHIVMANPDEVSDEIKAVYERVEEHHGTHDAYTRVIHGGENRDGTSLIFECRLPSADERADLSALGSDTDLDCAPIARDAFIFIVNETSKLEGLTLDQVRGIYTGQITNWQEVGGPDQEIEPITRNRNSGSQETMRHLVMCGRDTVEFLEDPAEIGMAAPFGRLHHDRDGKAVAYTFHSYWEHMVGRRGTKALAINGVKPTAETIRSGEYPLCESVYAVIRSDEPEGSPTRRLWNWLVTDAGQAIIEKTGYVSRRQAWPTPESDPRYERATWPRIDGSTSAYRWRTSSPRRSCDSPG
jgi:phosphate transport system substrate-binding protein